MNLPRSPLVFATVVVAAAGAGFVGQRGGLQAHSGTGPVPYLDDDRDGLDNALEQRLGLAWNDADTDHDGFNDRTELIYGTDPRTPDQPGQYPAAKRSVTIEAYATATQFVVQVFAHSTDSVDFARFHFASETNVPSRQYFQVDQAQFAQYLNRVQMLPSNDPAFHVTSARFALPLASLGTLGSSFAMAIQMVLDGNEKVADQLRFHNYPSAGLTEVREVSVQGSGSSSGGTGGLFPADPNLPPPPDEVIANQVCVQELHVSGLLGAGGVLYSVANAYCDSLLEATCSVHCADSTGGTVVGIDIASLIN